jgi:type II secretory pathway predicted ATPase ExeA
MYAEHFGFSELPFSITPNPQIFFTNSVYQEAFAALQYGVLAKRGFVVVTGEVGTGKTTLLRKLLHSVGPTVHSVFIFNTQVSFEELLRLILDDLSLSRDNADKLTMIEILNEYLIERLGQGHIVTLLIDEAQKLCGEVLEGLRLLSNLETDTQKLLQIVLVGQPELEIKLADPRLRQLKQRISFQLRLTPLKGAEVRAYIDFRLSAAGFRGKNLFNRASVQAVTFYSKGIPRLINIICDNALLAAFAASKPKVSAQLVEEVARDLQLNGRRTIEAPRPGNHRIAAKPHIPSIEEELPQFENVFAGAEDRYRTDLRQKCSLLVLGVGLLVVSMFLGSIAVSYSPPTHISLSDLATSREDFSREASTYLSDSTGKFQDFFEAGEQYVADTAVRVEELSIEIKDYLQAKAGDFYRRIAEYLPGLVQEAKDLFARGE